MNSYVALLRAVNVGGTGKLAMAELRDALARHGFADVRTLLQSGNVVFRSAAKTAGKTEQQFEAAVENEFGLKTDFLVRSAAEWRELVAQNPFAAEAQNDPARLAVVVLKSAPTAAQVAALRAAIKGPERVAARGRQAYAFYPDGMGRSKLTLPVIEKHLGARGTARNWNTVSKIAALLEA